MSAGRCIMSFTLVTLLMCTLSLSLISSSTTKESGDTQSTSTSPLDAFQLSANVKKIEWNYTQSDSEFLSFVLSHSYPLVIVNSPATKWTATSRWKELSYLRSKLPYLDKIRRGKDQVFVYESPEKKPLEHIHTRKKEFVGMEAQEWFDKFTAKKKQEKEGGEKEEEYYYYYSYSLEEEKGFKPLTSDLQPHDYFFVDDVTHRESLYPFLFPSSSSSIKHSANIWMGNDVVAQPHYDVSNNFFFQVEGTKRWILSSADDAYFYYLHPWAHPCERQSHANLTHLDAEEYMYFAEGQTLVADLSPGELLYVPAYWIHTVHSSSFSISVNFWSTSFFGYVAEQIAQESMPSDLTNTTDPKELSKNTAYFLKYLIKNVRRFDNIMEVRTFLLEELVKNRYGPFLHLLSNLTDEFDANKCPADGDVREDVKKRLDDKIDKLKEKFDVYEEESRRPLNERQETERETMDRSHYCWGVQTIELLDYVEKVVTYVLDHNSLANFFQCLTTRGWVDQQELEEEEQMALQEGENQEPETELFPSDSYSDSDETDYGESEEESIENGQYDEHDEL